MRYPVICIFLVCFQKSAIGIPVEPELKETEGDISTPSSSSLGINGQSTDDTATPIVSAQELNLNQGGLNLDPSDYGNDITDCKDKCVWYYQCENGTINTNGDGLFILKESQQQCGSFRVCCKLEDIINTTTRTPPPLTQPSEGCGYSKTIRIVPKITGYEQEDPGFGEYPWMVAIFENDGNIPKCGGALIHPQAVITAAHCVNKKQKSFSVRAGELNLNDSDKLFLHQEVPVQSITIHQKFVSGPVYNDIAFLYLEKPMKLTVNVGVICLPPQNHVHDPTNGRCYSTGWGKNKEGSRGQYQSTLKKIDLPIVPKDTCQSLLRQTRLGEFFNLHESFMCAGGEKDKDTCTGDGGSPLVCPLEGSVGKYYQAGIVAWGVGCGMENEPGVYVDVAQFRDWIDEQMQIHELDTEDYRAN